MTDAPPPYDVEVNITVRHRDLCGLFALMKWIEGVEVNNSKVPGNFELTMLYRQLCKGKKIEYNEVNVGDGLSNDPK